MNIGFPKLPAWSALLLDIKNSLFFFVRQELYQKSKQTSDLPDVLGSPKGNGKKSKKETRPDSGSGVYRYNSC